MKLTTRTERRQSKRKNVKSGVIAVLSSAGSIEIGKVIDISAKGLSFIADNDNCTCNLKDSVTMDILLVDENIFLEQTTSSVISSTRWQNNIQINRYHTATRYGVKFEKLEPSQERQLRELATATSA